MHCFFGFWGNSYNDYRNAVPHEGLLFVELLLGVTILVLGYQILRKWKTSTEERNGEVLARMKKLYANAKSPCFVYTSNIDRFALTSGLAASSDELYEYHGDLFTWQCSKPCSNKLWTAPESYRFDVDPETMLCVPKKDSFVPSMDKAGDPRLEGPDISKQSFSGPLPVCPFCPSLTYARPSILMFNSDDTLLWQRKDFAEKNWEAWKNALLGSLRRTPARIVIVEVGAGTNVPSLRFHGERFMSDLKRDYRSCPPVTLIRINPDYPNAEDPALKDNVIGIQMAGLPALKMIDAAMEQIKLNALM